MRNFRTILFFVLKAVFLLALILKFNGCNIDYHNNKLIGDWSFIDDENNYSEVYITSDKILFFSDVHGQMGPYPLIIKKDSLYYVGNTFKYSFRDCNNSLIVQNYEDSLFLNRINLKKIIVDTSSVNPFHIRKCYFLVQNGLMTMGQVYEYLDSVRKIEE